MNYQKKPSKEILHIFKEREINYIDVDYFAYPVTFPSTAGPSGGIGGCAMSTFTVEAYVIDNYGPVVYVCGNYFYFSKKKFKPFYADTQITWHKMIVLKTED